MNIQLLIIDPQMDFCDSNGTMYVKGGEKDIDRLSLMINRLQKKIDNITCTLDSHHRLHIANPGFWINSSGKNPDPFTIISKEDVENGTWSPSIPSLYQRALQYVKDLESTNRYQLCVWPIHAQIGTTGHSVMSNLLDVFNDWEDKKLRIIDMITKGSNPLTEHYSCFKAECPDPSDPTTQLNTDLVKKIMEADQVAIAGEASSHCVASSVIDLANAFGDDSYVSKLVYLKDASSPVAGFEQLTDDFLKHMTSRGMKISTTTEWLAG